MSNVACLIGVQGPRPVATLPENTAVLRVGYGIIPAAWLACFRFGDTRAVNVPLQDAHGQPGSLALDMLFTERDKATQSLGTFLSSLRSCPAIFADAEAPLLALKAHLHACPFACIQLFDVEIQLLVGPDENRPWLDTCLRFVGDVASGKLAGDAILKAPGALELFDQAEIRVPEWACEREWEESLTGSPAE